MTSPLRADLSILEYICCGLCAVLFTEENVLELMKVTYCLVNKITKIYMIFRIKITCLRLGQFFPQHASKVALVCLDMDKETIDVSLDVGLQVMAAESLDPE